MLNCKACSFDFLVWDFILCNVLARTLRNLLDCLDQDTGSLSLSLHASKGSPCSFGFMVRDVIVV